MLINNDLSNIDLKYKYISLQFGIFLEGTPE